MVQKLFDLSSHTVRNAVVAGDISNVSYMPLPLRRWIFDLFRMKGVLGDPNVIRVIMQPNYFNGFTTIEVLTYNDDDDGHGRAESLESNRSFVVTLATILIANRHLVDDITELKLCCGDCKYEGRSIKKVLSLCRNLRRLQLDIFIKYDSRVPVLHGIFELAASPLSSLEHLALICNQSTLYFNWAPKGLFRTLRSLKLHNVSFRSDTYLTMLQCCQSTLTFLDMSCTYNGCASFSLVPILLPKLTSLSFKSAETRPLSFGDIVKHCPSLMSAVFEIDIGAISETELPLLAQLSTQLQLHIFFRTVPFVSELVKVAGENIVGLTCCETLTSGDYDQILSNCRNLSSLAIIVDGKNEMFVQKLLHDKSRAEKLIKLIINGDLSERVLKLLFTNCCNLRDLEFCRTFVSVNISDYLKMWVENGARPVSLYLRCMDGFNPEDFHLLIKSAGCNLKYMKLCSGGIHEAVHDLCLNRLVNYCPMVKVFTLSYYDAAVHRVRLIKEFNKYQDFCFYNVLLYTWGDKQ